MSQQPARHAGRTSLFYRQVAAVTVRQARQRRSANPAWGENGPSPPTRGSPTPLWLQAKMDTGGIWWQDFGNDLRVVLWLNKLDVSAAGITWLKLSAPKT